MFEKIIKTIKKGVFYSSKIDVFSSFFAGSVLAKIFVKQLTSKIDLTNVFFFTPNNIPSLTKQLLVEKSYDISEFLLIIFFTTFIYLLNLMLASLRKKKPNIICSLTLLLATVILFYEATFLSFSSLRLGCSAIFLFLLYNIFRLKNNGEIKSLKPYTFLNGLLLGYYLLLLSSTVSASVSIPLILFLSAPFIYLAFTGQFKKYDNNIFHLLFLVSAFFTYKIIPLIIIGLVFLGLTFFVLPKIKSKTKKIFKTLYIFAFVFILSYNPLFYLGSFDSIEEGFWLGWLQRLLVGESLYKDVAVYHPPILIWGLSLFSKIFNPSIYSMRLYFHILKVFGFFTYFLLSSKLIKNRLTRTIVFITILVLSMTQVRNNVEIRTALGIVSLLSLHQYSKSKKIGYILLSGIITAIAIFSSIEVGIASLMAISLTLVTTFRGKELAKTIFNYLSGIFLGTIPILTKLHLTGSLGGFLSQLSFYGKAFISGYLNSSFPRIGNLTLIQWHVAYKYFASSTWFWELALLGTLSALLSLFYKYFSNKHKITDRLTLSVVFFTMILSRAALGRSDMYHLLFILPISLILLTYTLESMLKKKKAIYVAIIFIIFNLLFFRENLNNLLQYQLITYQSYGKPPGNYPNFNIERGHILTGIEVDVEEEKLLINYVKNNTSKNDQIFVYPWNPEIYFLTDRKNSTSFDTPLAFYNNVFQEKMIDELDKNMPNLILYNPDLRLGNLHSGSLEQVDEYIKENYEQTDTIGEFDIYKNLN